MKTLLQKIFGLTGFFLLATAASAQDYALDWFTPDSGGGTSAGGVFAVRGAITQPEADAMSGGNFTLTGGFSSLIAAVTPTVPPMDASTTISDNTGGQENGLFGTGGDPAYWVAGKFCLGSQPYELDSVSLLLSTGGSQPQGSNTLRLQIYSNDPVRGKPSASTGLIMNLSGLTNPIAPPPSGQGLVKWIPATPFRLSANACYWAVFTVESGRYLGQIVSVTKPAGPAGTFGRTQSADAGATWGAPDNSSNFKMLIRGTASGTPPPTPELAAGTQTAIPGGTGNFTSLIAPSLSGNNLVFYGTGSGGQQGIYLTDRAAIIGPPYTIADLKTPIPNGTGNFLSFGTEAGIIIVSGNTGVFAGTGAGGQRGIYAAVMVPPQIGLPFRIADGTTAIPGGRGPFTEFPNTPGISGNTAVFAGNGTSGQRGVYAAVMVPPQVGSPLRIADTATAIPGGSGMFTEFPNGQSISGNNVVFAGNGAGGQRGVYAAVMVPPQVGSPLRIADTATAIPGGTGNFSSFGSEAGIIIVSGRTAVFAGGGVGGQRGIYGARLRAAAVPAFALHGAGGQPGTSGENDSIADPPLYRIADTATAIPDGTGNFTGFGAVSLSESAVAFLGTGAGDQTGIYAMAGGQLLKVISVGKAIQGRTITGLSFSRDGLSDDGAVAFQATFSDGSQGAYTFEVPTTTELRITAVSLSGTELRISLPASSGQRYVLESRGDLAAGAWAEIPGTTRTGNGALLQVAIPNALAQPQQFYRVKQSP